MTEPKVLRIAAFSMAGAGGNPAGVMLCGALPEMVEMQRIAARIGYSETVFAAPQNGGFRTRYFAPDGEVPFCGHATIALGAALGAAQGEGRYRLILNDSQISVATMKTQDTWESELTSPDTSHRAVDAALLAKALALFQWNTSDLDPALPPALIFGGAEHLLLAVSKHQMLRDMAYDFEAGAALMRAAGLVTINLVWRESADRFHARNAFAGHGVYEDPATGAAAAALAGYLRDTGVQAGSFEILQGAEMGAASLLRVTPTPGRGGPIKIAGQTRMIPG